MAYYLLITELNKFTDAIMLKLHAYKSNLKKLNKKIARNVCKIELICISTNGYNSLTVNSVQVLQHEHCRSNGNVQHFTANH